MSMEQNYYEQALSVFRSFFAPLEGSLEQGRLLVVGCSSSEILGGMIGKSSSPEVGEQIARAALEITQHYGLALAAQCCEHLNRALIMERKEALAFGYELVSVVPYPKAGGSFGSAVYRRLKDPVAVLAVQADFGVDIGLTMIGMHLRRVAVPVRLSEDHIGAALVTAAKTRPMLIGGERAHYSLDK